MSEKSVSSLVIMTLPKNLDCLIGGKGVDPAGGRICAIFDDGDFKEIPMTNEEVSIECPTDKEGNSLATVFYGASRKCSRCMFASRSSESSPL